VNGETVESAANHFGTTKISKDRSVWLWYLPAAVVAGVLSVAIIRPAYSLIPPPGFERDFAAVIEPSPYFVNYFFPWLTSLDRRLIVFGWLTVTCFMVALFVLPALLANRVARDLQQAGDPPPEEVSAILSRRLREVWKPWAVATVVLTFLFGVGNLIAIQKGMAPSFPAYQIQFSFSHLVIMVLPALIALPLGGLLVGVLSVAAGMLMRQPLQAAVMAYPMMLIGVLAIGMFRRDIPATVHEFLPPPGIRMWSMPRTMVEWGCYILLTGLTATLVWYFTSPSARQHGKT
jgi:uncharacterized membrane protein